MAGHNENQFSDAQREEIEHIARDVLIKSGLDSNGPSTRQRNIQRMQFVDKMLSIYTNSATWVGQAVIWFAIAAFVAFLGFKGSFGN